MDPVVLVLLIADRVHRDDVSGKFHINGTRHLLRASSFPYDHPLLVVYAVLTEGRGDVTVRVRLVDVDEARMAVAEEDLVVQFPDPLREVEVAIPLQDLIFPLAGDYRLQLLVDERVLQERRLMVVL